MNAIRKWFRSKRTMIAMLSALAVLVGLSGPAQTASASAVAPASVVQLANQSPAAATPSAIQAPGAAIVQSAVMLSSSASSVFVTSTAAMLTTYTPLCEGGIRKGPGLKLGNDQVVMYMCLYKGHDYALLCPDPTKPASNPTAIKNVTSASGATNFAAASYVAWYYGRHIDGGGSKRYDNNYAAATRLAYWAFMGLSSRVKTDLAYASDTVKNLYTSMVTNATKYAGPYKVTYVSQVLPKLTGTGWTLGSRKYRVTSAKGYGVPGVAFTWKVTAGSASLPAATVKSDSNGYFTVSYRPTTWQQTTFAATSAAVAANSQKFWVPIYSSYQRFFSGLSTVLKTGFTVDTRPSNSLAYDCTTACFGEAPVKATKQICNTYGTSVVVELLDNGALRPEKFTPAAGACVTPIWKVKDNHTAAMRLGVLVNGVWKYYTFTTIVVDCPPWPTVQFSGAFNCLEGSLTVTAPANPEHKVRVTVNGSTVTSTSVGAPATKTIAFSCDVAHPFTIQTGVQRDNGAWNSSPVANVGFPAVVS